MNHVLRGAGATLQLFVYDANGDLANGPAGAMTADVKDSAGVAISGSPFTVTNPPATTGTYLVALPTTLALLDTYDVTWHMGDASLRYSQFEMVGGFLFSIADLKAFDTVLAEAAYTAAKITAARDAVEETFEHPQVGRVAFRLRGSRDHLDGTGKDSIMLEHIEPTSIVSVKVNGVAFSSAELADLRLYAHGKVTRDQLGAFGHGVGNVEVFYTHGLASTPAPVHIAAKRFARYLLVETAFGINERSSGVFTEGGTGYRLTIAGRDGWTGLPFVDSVLKQWTRRAPGFA
jgi:hypothetical protein